MSPYDGVKVLFPGPANEYVLFPVLTDENVPESLSIKAHWNGTTMLFLDTSDQSSHQHEPLCDRQHGRELSLTRNTHPGLLCEK